MDASGKIEASRLADTGFDPITEAQKLVDGIPYDRMMATGYGRNLFEIAFDAPTVIEIKASLKVIGTLILDNHNHFRMKKGDITC